MLLDEFNVFESDSIINFINKTRSFNYQFFLCFQVTDDLSTDKKKLLNTIFGNVGKIIAHKVRDGESPEEIARVFGTRTVKKITKQYDTKNKKSSKGLIREVEQYILHPNDLKRLKTGQAYCKILLTNANQFINKINIKNYFNNISSLQIFNFFKYKLNTSIDIARILTVLSVADNNTNLKQGLETSLILSFLVNIEIFEEIYRYCYYYRYSNIKKSEFKTN